MLITVVRQWNIDNSHGRDAVLAEATSSCCRWTVKSASRSRHSFLSFSIMTDLLENIVNEFDWRVCWPPSFFLKSAHSCSLTIMVLSVRKSVLQLLNSKVCLPHLLIHLFYVCLIPTDLINRSMQPTMVALNMAAPAMAAPNTAAKHATAAAAVTAASMLLASCSCC